MISFPLPSRGLSVRGFILKKDFIFYVVLAVFLFIAGLVVFYFVDYISGDSQYSKGVVLDKLYIPGHYEETKNIASGKKELNYVKPEYSFSVRDDEFGLISIDVSAENYKRIHVGYVIGYDLMIGGISGNYVGASSLEIIEKSD